MRFLFILDRVENPASANALLGRRLAAELQAAGHEIHLLELWDGQTPCPAAPQGMTLHTLAFADERLMNEALENGVRGGTPVPLRLLRLAAHPTAAAAAFRQLVLHAPRRTVDTRRMVERLDAAYHYDAVCAVGAPYRAAFALETARIGGKKLLWQLDPYASNRDYRAPGGFAREGRLLDAVHATLVTPQALPDYEGGPLSPWRGKVYAAGFPVLLPVPPAPPHEGTRCVFCGSLYPALREPDFALQLFTALDDPALTLTMAGGGWQRFEPQARRAQAALGSRFVRPGPVPPEQAAALEAGADILLSLGNRYDNQMPSKLFGYFGSGKPVLHLAVSDGDPTLPYLERYPLALVLRQQDGVTGAVLARLRRWLAEVRGRRLPYEEAAALYPDFTPRRVAGVFLAAVQ